MNIERILVPIEFSPASLRAVEFAGELALQLGARIRFVTVLDVGDLRAALRARLRGFTTDKEVQDELQRWIREQYALIRLPPGVNSTRALMRGVVEQQILKAISSYRPQLVVIGSQGLGRRIPIGSTAREVVRRSTVPVVIVPALTDHRD